MWSRRIQAAYPPMIREAIGSSRAIKGMTREQTPTTPRDPLSSENPSLAATLWRYWLTSFCEFQVAFDAAGKTGKVTADAQTRNLVWMP